MSPPRQRIRRWASHLPDGLVAISIFLLALLLVSLLMAVITVILTQFLRLAGGNEEWILFMEGMLFVLGLVIAFPMIVVFAYLVDQLNGLAGHHARTVARGNWNGKVAVGSMETRPPTNTSHVVSAVQGSGNCSVDRVCCRSWKRSNINLRSVPVVSAFHIMTLNAFAWQRTERSHRMSFVYQDIWLLNHSAKWFLTHADPRHAP